jgi:hypothetical protein
MSKYPRTIPEWSGSDDVAPVPGRRRWTDSRPASTRSATWPAVPSTVELEFGVKFSVEAGAVIARTGVEGHLKVKVVWESQALHQSQNDEGEGEGEDVNPTVDPST